jgi:tetratricopeptide (TPR) repeat protein
MTAARRRLALGGVALALLAAAGLVWAAFFRPARPPAPPEVDLTGADPVVAAVVEGARAEVARSPRSPDAWGRLGMVLLAHSFNAEAAPCLAEAERLAPGDRRWPYYRALALTFADTDSAIEALRRAVALSGDEAAPRLRLAELRLGQGEHEEAEGLYREVLAQEANNPWARLGLGRSACGRGAWADALPHLRAAAASPATEKAAQAALAEAHQHLRQPKAAARAARRAAELSEGAPPPDPLTDALEQLQVGRQARLARASRLMKQGRAAEAVALLERVVEDDPESASAWLGLGRALIQARRYPQAERALRRAVRLGPGLAEGAFYLGVALFEQGRAAEAAEHFLRATELRPDHGVAWYNLGHCRKALGDRTGAVSAFREAVRYKPHFAEAHLELGRALAANGKGAEAKEHLRQAAELGAAAKKRR